MKRIEIMTEIRKVSAAMILRAVELDHLDHTSPEFAKSAEADARSHREVMRADIARLRAHLNRLEELCDA